MFTWIRNLLAPDRDPDGSMTVGRRVIGDGTWPWSAEIDGADLVIRNAIVTAFGGAGDKMDSGETASGISTKRHPEIIACSLPMRRDANRQLRGSPIPHLEWHTPILFRDEATGREIHAPLIDEGPAKWTGHAGDLTVAAARFFDPHATANRFERRLTIRIPNAARLVQ